MDPVRTTERTFRESKHPTESIKNLQRSSFIRGDAQKITRSHYFGRLERIQDHLMVTDYRRVKNQAHE